MFHLWILVLVMIGCGENNSKIDMEEQVYEKKWVISEESLDGYFQINTDGSLSGSDGCNSCGFSEGSVKFLKDGTIEWSNNDGPLCTKMACYTVEDENGDELLPQKSFFINKTFKSFKLIDEETLEISKENVSYQFKTSE